MIKGTMGYCDSTVKSATYGPGQQQDFIDDAKTVGQTVDVVDDDYMCSRNADGLISGEYNSKVGGQLAWPA
jgi:hypothetical protein